MEISERSRVEDRAAGYVVFFPRALTMRKMVDPTLQPEVVDFRLFSREAVLAVRRFREQHRFMRGLVAWLGLREAILPSNASRGWRRNEVSAVENKYDFAWTAIVSFSALPLRLTVTGGVILASLGILYALCSTYEGLVLHHTVPGWTSLTCLVTIFSGAILVAIGLEGDYVARIFEEAKGRPLYIVSDLVNLDQPLQPPERVLAVSRHSTKSQGKHGRNEKN